MKIVSDFHMHSKYSGDCKNEIEDVVNQARQVGLTTIAITDHGPGHSGYGIKISDYPKIRQEIDALNRKYDDINILLGIEANILSKNGGELDITEDMLKINDILLAGYHFGSQISSDYKMHIYNVLSKHSKRFYEKAKIINTEAMINVMRNNNIHMITHPGAKGPIDIEAVAKVAEETNTVLEINNGHGHLNVDEIKIAKKYDIKFAVNSDAHGIERVGVVDRAVDRAIEAGLSEKDIINCKEASWNL